MLQTVKDFFKTNVNPGVAVSAGVGVLGVGVVLFLASRSGVGILKKAAKIAGGVQ